MASTMRCKPTTSKDAVTKPSSNRAAVATAPVRPGRACTPASRTVTCRAVETVTKDKPMVLEFTSQSPVELQTTSARYALRHQTILESFPNAIGTDDFIARVEIALAQYGFTGANSIAMTNLCRDEVTVPLKDKIEAVFGSSFNTNGLGGVLTCGITGLKAGFSHSPVTKIDGKERYVFFSFPHIAIDSAGTVGSIFRPGRPGQSCACGAMAKCLGELKGQGIVKNCKVPGVHEPEDPEYTILKQRIARRIRNEQLDLDNMDMVSLTKAAERTITSDLELLIEKTVDPAIADYAVVTGIQVHNWAVEGTGEPHMEFVATGKVYVSVDGVIRKIDLGAVPTLPPRLISLTARVSEGKISVDEALKSITETSVVDSQASTLQGISSKVLNRRIGAAFMDSKSGQ